MEASATTPSVAPSASLTTPNQTAATPSTPAPSGGAKPKKVQTSIQSFFNTNEEQMDLSENRRREREEAGSPNGEEPPPKRAQSDSMITNTSIGVMNSPISEMINEATENIDEVFPVIKHTETANNFAPEAISRNTDILLDEAYSLVNLPYLCRL